MTPIENILIFAHNEPESDELRDMVRMLTNESLKEIGRTAAILSNEYKTEKSKRDWRENPRIC